MATEVNPETLLFTQDSIKNTFKEPHQNGRIDDAVVALLAGNMRASDFPRLKVVAYDGRLWSLDNRRLWVFKKAQVPSITVNISHYVYKHPRMKELIERNPWLQRRILEPGYWPKVRGPCRQEFHPPAALCYPKPVPVDHKPIPKFDAVVDLTPKACTFGNFRKDSIALESSWPLPGKNNVPEAEFDRAPIEIFQKVERDATASVMRYGDAVLGTLPTETELHTVASLTQRGKDLLSGPDAVASILQDAFCMQDRLENHLSGSPPGVPVVVDIIHDSSHARYGMEDRPAGGFAPDATVSILRDGSYGEEELEGYPFFSAPEAAVNILHDASHGQDRKEDDLAPCVPEAIVNISNHMSHRQEDLRDAHSLLKTSLDTCLDSDSAQNSGNDSSRSMNIWVMLYRKVLGVVKLVRQKSVEGAKHVCQKLVGAAKFVHQKSVGGANLVYQKLLGGAQFVHQKLIWSANIFTQKLVG